MKREPNRRSVRGGLFSVLLILASLAMLGGSPAQAFLLVSNSGAKNITAYDWPSGTYAGVWASTGSSSPMGITSDLSGNVYVSYASENKINKFGPGGVDLGTFASTGLSSPEFIAVHNGFLYASNYGNGKIRKFALDGTDLGDFASPSTTGIEGMAWDTADNLYVSVYNGPDGGTIRKIAPDGTDLGLFASVGSGHGLEGLVRDSAGNFYVVDYTFQNIHKFSPTGSALGTFAAGKNYYGLAIDENDVLYAPVIFDNAIRNFAADGTDLGNFTTTGLNSPVMLAFVPEPGSGTLLAAAALMLMATRRRQNA